MNTFVHSAGAERLRQPMVLPPVLARLTISPYFKSPLLIATTPFPAPLKQHWDGSFIFLCIFVSLSSSSSYTSIYTILPYTLCTTSLQVPKGCCKVGLKKCNAKLWCARLCSKIYSSFLLFTRDRLTQCDDLGVTYWSFSCDRLKSAHLWFILKHILHIFFPVFLSRK